MRSSASRISVLVSHRGAKGAWRRLSGVASCTRVGQSGQDSGTGCLCVDHGQIRGLVNMGRMWKDWEHFPKFRMPVRSG